MRITDVLVDITEWQSEPIPVADVRESLGGTVRLGVVRVRTDEGFEGNGLIGPLDSELSQSVDQITTILKPRILERSPSDREWIWSRLDSWAGHGLPLQPAWAPVDIALWDLEGKAAGVPVHQLLGTFRQSAPVMATAPPQHTRPEDFASEVADAAERGFTAYKIHPGDLNALDTAAFAELAREAVGPDMALMLDPNNGYDFDRALQVGRALDDQRFAWFEDPVLSDDWEAITGLSARLDTPLAISDALGFLLRQSSHAVRLRAAGIIRGNARKLGITGLKKLCGMLEAFSIPCEIGFGGNALTNAANAHLVMSAPNSGFYEHVFPTHFHEIGVLNPITVRADGTIAASSVPGIGIHLDEAAIKRHTVETLR